MQRTLPRTGMSMFSRVIRSVRTCRRTPAGSAMIPAGRRFSAARRINQPCMGINRCRMDSHAVMKPDTRVPQHLLMTFVLPSRLPQNTFAPKNKTKGLFDKTKALMSKRKPEQSFCYAPTEESGCIFYMRFFSRILSREWRRRRIARIIHIPGRICHFALGFCKNKKKRTETLYQSFSPFMVPMAGLEPA